MREGEEIWYCSRIVSENAEIDEYEEAKKLTLRMPRPFQPIGITVQPKNGFTDRLSSGETTSKDQRIILTPYTYWHNKFKEGDLFYLSGAKPDNEESYNGENANYMVDVVLEGNEAIELSTKKIIKK